MTRVIFLACLLKNKESCHDGKAFYSGGKNIRKSFGELDVLKDISLTAHRHDVISIIGASGSGKSTFLRCINCLELPDAGSVAIEGEEIEFHRRNNRTVRTNPGQLSRLRAQMGMVFQNFNL